MNDYSPILECVAARRVGRGWDASCPIAYRHRHHDRHPSLRLWIGSRGELVARCLGCGATWGELVQALNTTARDWWPDDIAAPRRGVAVGKVVAIYDYRDARGNLYAQKLRKEPGLNGASKSFSWRRPLPEALREIHAIAPGQAAWVWGIEEGLYAPHEGDLSDWRSWRGIDSQAPPEAARLPLLPLNLFHLERLAAVPLDRPVGIVEGEKKALALEALTGTAWLSSPNGARSWNWLHAESFRGRKVVVIPDNDTAGIGHVSVVCGSLMLFGVSGLKLIAPGPLWPIAEGEDVLDWLARFPKSEQRGQIASLFGRFAAYTLPSQPALLAPYAEPIPDLEL